MNEHPLKTAIQIGTYIPDKRISTVSNIANKIVSSTGILDLSGIDETPDKLLFYELALDGIVVDPVTAELKGPCKCTKTDYGDICWKKGIIGTLSKQQRDEYCPVEKRYYEKTRLNTRLNQFAKVSQSCEVGQDNVNDIADRLVCMHKGLEKRGVNV